jgi:hypothetical protein
MTNNSNKLSLALAIESSINNYSLPFNRFLVSFSDHLLFCFRHLLFYLRYLYINLSSKNLENSKLHSVWSIQAARKSTITKIRIQLKIMMRIRIQTRGGGTSSKNVRHSWQNPRYAPDYHYDWSVSMYLIFCVRDLVISFFYDQLFCSLRQGLLVLD